MRRLRVIKSDSFRLAALFALLFLACTGILIATVLVIVEGRQRAAVTAANDDDIATVTNGYLDEGVPEAVEVVKQRLGVPRATRVAYPDVYMVLADEHGTRLAGNMPMAARTIGVVEIALPLEQPRQWQRDLRKPGPRAVLGRGVELTPGVYLFVGRDTALLTATRERIVHAFLWVGLGAVLIAVCGGLFLGSRFMRRVDAIGETCKAIIAGRLHERIAITGRGGEWDRLAGAVNDMLNRIAALLENLRQVSSDVAHDLRTPLTRTRDRLEAARAGSPSVEGYAMAVARAIDDMDEVLSMFSAVLRISQIEAGTRQGTFAAVHLSELLQNVAQMFGPVAEDSGHALSAAIAPDVYIHGDAELLTQLFSNLVDNALRHTPRGTRIEITLDSDANETRAAVADDGPGIDPGEHDKVLRRFYRVSSSRRAPGHGLGLALVAAIAQLHHAELRLVSLVPGIRITVAFSTAT